jgi:hypothetical protein
MSDPKVSDIVAQAVGMKFQEWAAEHPALASVIDQIRLTDQAAESLRGSPAYRQAVEAYYRDRSELSFLTELLELVGPIVGAILGA